MSPEPTGSPFKLICGECGADADAADAVFAVGSVALLAEADVVLMPTRCETCGTATDVALFPIDRAAIAAFLAEGGGPDADAAALHARYVAAVDDYAQQTQRQLDESAATDELAPPLATLDLERLDLDPLLEAAAERPFALPAVALAAMRGARRAVEAHPEPLVYVRVCIGLLTCVLSVDSPVGEPASRVLHVSVSVAGAAPSPLEQLIALALCFEPGERPLVRAEVGQTRPVVHYYLVLPTEE